MVALETCDNLQSVIDSVPAFSREVITLPEGDHYLDTITIMNRGIVLQGGAKTTLHFKGTGIIIDTTWSGAGRVHLNDLNIVGSKVGGDNGIEVHAIANITNCNIKNFGGIGLCLSADMGDHKRNISLSQINNVLSEQSGAGFYIHGGDSSQVCFFGCDARDNDGWGFEDASFLGCQFFGCMAHANKAGHYKTTDANNRSSFFGCYGEGDSPKNSITGNTTFIGGLVANGFNIYGNASVQCGKIMSSAKFGGATFEITSDGITFLQEVSGSFPTILKRIKGDPFAHFGYSDFSGVQHEFFTASKQFNANYAGRKITFSSDGFKTFFIGSRLFAEGKPDDKRFDGFQFKFGDTLLNPDYDGETIREWVYKKSGWEAVL